MEYELFKEKSAYPQKSQITESTYESPKLGTENYFSFLKQSYPDFEEIIRSQAVLVKNKKPILRQAKMLYLENDLFL